MYQVTFMDCGELHALTFDEYHNAEAVYFSLQNSALPRLWVFTDGRPHLMA